MRITLATIAALGLLGWSGQAEAQSLSGACQKLARTRAAGCTLDARAGDAQWNLTTRLVIGTGKKAHVTAVEREFCDTVERLGKAGRVTRWSAIPGGDGGARMDWTCGLPAVSATARPGPR